MKSPNDYDAFRRTLKPVGEIIRPRSWVVYGRSGSGKTTFASTFPKPILLLDVRDQGTDSISDTDVIVKQVEDWEDFDDAYYFLKYHPNEYKSLIIDTVTQMQLICLEHVVSKKRKKIDHLGDWGTVSLREYGDVAARMKEKITNFRDLPMEVCFIAQEKTAFQGDNEEENDPTQLMVPEVGPAAMKSVTGHLNASVSIIGHKFVRLRRFKYKTKDKEIEMEEAVHCLRFGAHPIYTTKTRKPKSVEVADYIENPTHEDVVEMLEGH